MVMSDVSYFWSFPKGNKESWPSNFSSMLMAPNFKFAGRCNEM